jgi:hypothetical protein
MESCSNSASCPRLVSISSVSYNLDPPPPPPPPPHNCVESEPCFDGPDQGPFQRIYNVIELTPFLSSFRNCHPKSERRPPPPLSILGMISIWENRIRCSQFEWILKAEKVKKIYGTFTLQYVAKINTDG